MTEEEKRQLAKEVTELIIERLNIKHIIADDVKSGALLFGEENDMELDSIDGIEIVIALQQVYGARITDEQPAREILTSIDTIVEFLIKENATTKIA